VKIKWSHKKITTNPEEVRKRQKTNKENSGANTKLLGRREIQAHQYLIST
jgi:hypothetical protein